MYTAGTISGTKGSTKITGKSTQWLSNLYNILEGQVIIIYTPTSSNAYSIKNIKSNTEIELSRPLYDAVTNATYEIFTTIDNTTSDAAVKIATSIARNNEFMGLMNQWTTGTGTVTVNWGGEQVKLTTVDQMNKNIDGKFDKSGGAITGPLTLGGNLTSGGSVVQINNEKTGSAVQLDGAINGAARINSKRNNGQWRNHVLPDSNGTLMHLGDFGWGGEGDSMNVPESDFIAVLKSKLPSKITRNDYGDSGSHFQYSAVAYFRAFSVFTTISASHIGAGVKISAGDTGRFYVYNLLTDKNTTKDSNGNLKAASPIVKVFADHIELNDESEGVELKCLHTGIYQLKHVLGLNSDASWGGINGGITIPSGINQLPLIYVDYDVLVAGEQHPFNGEPVPQEEHGDIVIYTSYRKHFYLPQNVQRARLKTYPEFTKLVGDERVELENGAPVDIPAGHWIDVRVNMPSNSIYNQK
ncbi:hypothetical protein V5049_11975 [Moellerella wisconsensis]|uniref:phage tail fiber protein n=1 Tax=Moellerella wisconsensis TaxID=158849 RepID=UPI0030764B1A